MRRNGGGPQLRLVVESRLENVRLVGAAIQRLAQRAGFGPATSDGVELAVVEVVTNSIRHGYANRPGRDVEVRARLHADRLEIEVRDSGTPPPPDLFDRERLALPDETTEGGRGAFLITSLMDEVELRSERGGNLIRLVKRRVPTPSRPRESGEQ